MDYEIVIGLEVHAELSTETKIYCGCKNAFGLEVNSLCCPVCTGMPGTLPVLNETVVEYAIKMGHALNCKINRICKQDRKNYFYPDLPKAYQISQFDVPLCEFGNIDILVNGELKNIRVTRIHIEEDAGKLLHDEAFSGSLVDFNRCGVPLIEIVSEPDMRSSAEAKAYLDSIKSTLQYLNISDCKMQEGSIRCDVNVSVRKKGATEYGTRCEMKNVNTFSGAVRGIEYEAKRQIAEIEAGREIAQETRRWDDIKGESIILRTKEDAHDYRYFPDPDLLTIVLSEDYVNDLKTQIPELPTAKVIRYIQDFGLSFTDAMIIAEGSDKSSFFDTAIGLGLCQPKSISNWLLGDISRMLNEANLALTETKLTPKNLAEMASLIEQGKISNTAGKSVLEVIFKEDIAPSVVVEKMGLSQISDTSALEQVAKTVLEANEKSVTDYKSGKLNALGFLVGQAMKESKGKGNPATLKEILVKLLEA